jgi:uncharacterized protein YbbC (DUF1343 family)
MKSSISALDQLQGSPELLEGLGRVAVVTNQAVCTQQNSPALMEISHCLKKTKSSTLCAVFGPQHGYFQTEQDNMIETPDLTISVNDQKVPLYSLYGEVREPTPQQLESIDTLVVDMLDMGCRIYTYMLTLAGCMRQASKWNKKIVVLDRPNPLGLTTLSKDPNSKGQWERVEGNLLDTSLHSFVGWYSMPMRHGLTMGELACYFKHLDRLDLDLSVLKVQNYKRNSPIERMEPWNIPSPNLPTWETSYFFPSFVMLEGTNVSEGRGTTLPFQIVGAPWLDSVHLITWMGQRLKNHQIHARPHVFRPTFNKHQGAVCHGIHLQPAHSFDLPLFDLGIWFITYQLVFHSSFFKWKEPGYEYNFTDLPINLILGNTKWHQTWEKHKDCESDMINAISRLLEVSKAESQQFATTFKTIHLYE